MTDTVPKVERSISVPAGWYLGAHGDPVAQFDHLLLDLMSDGSVRWRSVGGAYNAPSPPETP